MEFQEINGTKFRVAFVLVLVLSISALFLAVIWPFLQALLFAAILAGLFKPLHRTLTKVFRGRDALAAVATLLILFLLVIGPISALAGLVVQQAVDVSDHALPWVQQQVGTAGSFNLHDWLAKQFPAFQDVLPAEEEIANALGTAAKASGTYLVSSASAFTAGTAGVLLDFFVMIYAMFFFLRDGRKILEKIFYYMPLSHDDEVLMLERFVSVTKATIKGTLLIGLIQGSLAGIAFYFAGVTGAAFWGAIMVVLSIVPGIGAALVWVPAVIYLAVTGHSLAAILLGAWCAGVVGTVDNVLRPTLVGKDAKMPDLLILIGTLGGLFLFGPLGFIVGPIVCGLFLTAWDIYGVAFKNILPPVRSLKHQDLDRAASQERIRELRADRRAPKDPAK